MTLRCNLAWLVLMAAAPAQTLRAQPPLQQEMDEVARVASVMVDGDVCQRIQTARSLGWMLKQHPKDPWFASDNFDVDHQAFTAVKKVLIRLARLSSYPCDVNLWMPVPGSAGKIQVLIRNVNEMSQFWKWGDLLQDTPPEMKIVLETRKSLTVASRPGMVSVLAPVSNSMGDVVGLVEVVGRETSDPRENVK